MLVSSILNKYSGLFSNSNKSYGMTLHLPVGTLTRLYADGYNDTASKSAKCYPVMCHFLLSRVITLPPSIPYYKNYLNTPDTLIEYLNTSCFLKYAFAILPIV